MGSIGYINVVLETFGALFSLLVVAFVTVGAREEDRPRACLIRLLVCNAAVLLCDAGSWVFEGRADPLGRVIMELTTLGMFILSYVRLALFTDFIAETIASRGRNVEPAVVRFMWAACALAAVLASISLFNGMFYRIDSHGMYVRGPLMGFSQWFGVLCILVNGWLLARHRKAFTPHELLVLGLCVALPAIALAAQRLLYGISFLNLASTLVAVLLYLGAQMEREHAIREQKINLERCRMQLAVSQVQPKLLFNALDVIHGLCASDPPAAKEALGEFATYLRANTDALASTAPVPLERELEHVRAYLALERRLLGERLDVKYDIEASDFAVPALSLQFLVERAVERRCAGDAACGIVRISARDEGRAYRACVRDAGSEQPAGPDAAAGADDPDGSRAATLESMRTRIALLQGGTLEMTEDAREVAASIVVPKDRRAAGEGSGR